MVMPDSRREHVRRLSVDIQRQARKRLAVLHPNVVGKSLS
jgi:hypothetical protein